LLVKLAKTSNNCEVRVKQRTLVGHVGLGSAQVGLVSPVEGKPRRPIWTCLEGVFLPDIRHLEISILEGGKGVVVRLKEGMIFPLSKRDETKVAEMVGHENIQEQIAGNLPVDRPAEDLKHVNKPQAFGWS
jgi:hypothetical protein